MCVGWRCGSGVSVGEDRGWGRTYEAYGQGPALVSSLGAAFIRGVRNNGVGFADRRRRAVLASRKHFVADGGTTWGSACAYSWIPGLWQSDVPGRWQMDQGDAEVDEEILRSVHLPPYRSAIAAGALSVMVSYSSWNGAKVHAHRYLLTEVLKGELGFDGFVVSDWLGVSQLHPDFEEAVCRAINAGMDMVMVPFDYRRFIAAVEVEHGPGRIALSRMHAACRRILSPTTRMAPSP